MDIAQLKLKAAAIFPAYVQDLALLIAANSKNTAPLPGAPLGAGIKQALDVAVAIASRLGFRTKTDPDGYYAYAEIGQGQPLFGVLGHLDVVPADDTENWQTPPFTLTEKDGMLCGRGVVDDKGSLLAALYALRLQLDAGMQLTGRVRFIFCTDEETLWRGVNAYKAKEELPQAGFTPDADFPLVYAEKGIVQYYLRSTEATCPIVTAGTALNAVPGKAETPYDPAVEKALVALGYSFAQVGANLVVKGKAAHSMAADKGVNALVLLAQALVQAGKTSPMLRFITQLGSSPSGKKIFGTMQDSYSGALTFNLGLANWQPGAQSLGVDIRFPVSSSKEVVEAALATAAAEHGLTLELFNYLRPVHMATDTPLVQALMQAYQEVTGDLQSKPLSTGGGTFARSMDNIVAYGALLPGAPRTEHQVNERVSTADMTTAIAVYAQAFELLVGK